MTPALILPKILVVDDEPDLVQLLMRRLGRRGYQVLGAESKKRATELLAEEVFGVVICDIHLGDANGIDLYRERRACGGTEGFLFLSGLDSTEELGKQLEDDARCDFLPKPVDFQMLIEILAKIVCEQSSLS